MNFSDDSGFTMVGTLIALSLSLFVFVTFGRVTTQMFKSNQRFGLSAEAIAIRNQIQSKIDCNRTLGESLSVCSQSGIQLKKRNGFLTTPILTTGIAVGAGKILKNWYLRTSCGADSLVVELARLSPYGGFAKDPLTEKIMNFDYQRPIYGGPVAPKLCSKNFSSASAAGCKENEIRFLDGNLKRCNGGISWANLPTSAAGGRTFQISGSGNVTFLNFNSTLSITMSGNGDVTLLSPP